MRRYVAVTVPVMNVTLDMPEAKTAVAVPDATCTLAVETLTLCTAVAVPLDLVTPTVIEQSAVFSDAVTDTSDRNVIVAVFAVTPDTTVALAVPLT
jgi:hypothetical protein